MRWNGFQSLDSNDFLTDIPILISDILITGAASGDSVTVYEGQNASMGRKLHTLVVDSVGTKQFHFDPALRFEKGAYFDKSTNLSEISVCFRTIADLLDPPQNNPGRLHDVSIRPTYG